MFLKIERCLIMTTLLICLFFILVLLLTSFCWIHIQTRRIIKAWKNWKKLERELMKYGNKRADVMVSQEDKTT